jgi:hypothetical protein
MYAILCIYMFAMSWVGKQHSIVCNGGGVEETQPCETGETLMQAAGEACVLYSNIYILRS